MTKKPKVAVKVRVPPEVRARLSKLCQESGMTLSKQVERLILAAPLLFALLALGLSGCAVAAEPTQAHDCGGAPFAEVASGPGVACETIGEQCAYSYAAHKPVELETSERAWVCTCGGMSPTNIHLYWCKDSGDLLTD